MQISLLCFVRTGIAGIPTYIHTIQLRHLHRVQDWIAMPPRDATGDMLLAQTERGAWGGCPTCFSSIPAPCTSLACQQMVGHKKGSAHHQTPYQSAWTVRAKVPAQVDLLCARVYLPGHIVRSGTSETRCTLAVQLSEYIDQLSGCYSTSPTALVSIQRKQQGWLWKVRLGGEGNHQAYFEIDDDGDHSPMRQPSASASGSLFYFPFPKNTR